MEQSDIGGTLTSHIANARRMVLALILHEFGMTRPVVSIFHLPTHLLERQEDIHKSLSRAVSFSMFLPPKVQVDQLSVVILSVYSCQKPLVSEGRLTFLPVSNLL